jgi:hypothetical protein
MSKPRNAAIADPGRSLDTLHMNATPALCFERVLCCIH